MEVFKVLNYNKSFQLEEHSELTGDQGSQS
jgi:hypothetical protein